MIPMLHMTRTVPAASRSQWLALVVLCAGMLMIILDQTIVNVGLPTFVKRRSCAPSGVR